MRLKTLLSVVVYFLVLSLSAFGDLDLKFTGKISISPDPAAPGDPVSFSVSFNTAGTGVDNLLCIGGVDDFQLLKELSLILKPIKTGPSRLIGQPLQVLIPSGSS